MDEAQLTEEGYYAAFAAAGARIEIPGCSLCGWVTKHKLVKVQLYSLHLQETSITDLVKL